MVLGLQDWTFNYEELEEKEIWRVDEGQVKVIAKGAAKSFAGLYHGLGFRFLDKEMLFSGRSILDQWKHPTQWQSSTMAMGFECLEVRDGSHEICACTVLEKPLNGHFELSSIFVELEVFNACLTVFHIPFCKDVGAVWKVGPRQ